MNTFEPTIENKIMLLEHFESMIKENFFESVFLCNELKIYLIDNKIDNSCSYRLENILPELYCKRIHSAYVWFENNKERLAAVQSTLQELRQIT